MTTSGESPSGAAGVNEPDWIDQILERATRQVDDSAASPAAKATMPIVPETSAVAAPPDAPLVQRAPVPADGLAEIRWADSPEVTPASTPVASAEPVLVPQAVGRSAWDADLAAVGQTGDPDGWEKLSWQDLDDRHTEHSPMQELSGFGRILREWGPVLFAAVAIALFTRLVLVQAYHIPSGSMVPTLETGDRVVVNRLSYRLGEIERGQVVVFAKPPGSSGENDLIKRIVGLPGETIRFVDNQVYIDDRRVDEPYLAEPDSTRPLVTIPGCAQDVASESLCTIPEGYVFVMGDNRLGSSDSRAFGPIETDTVVGRAFLRVWPLNNLGQL